MLDEIATIHSHHLLRLFNFNIRFLQVVCRQNLVHGWCVLVGRRYRRQNNQTYLGTTLNRDNPVLGGSHLFQYFEEGSAFQQQHTGHVRDLVDIRHLKIDKCCTWFVWVMAILFNIFGN